MRRDEGEPAQPVAERREIHGLYFTASAHGPIAAALIIFVQLFIVKQTKYLAAENSSGENWIVWREKFSDGELCNGTGQPYPKNSSDPYARPEGYDSDCIWFPRNKSVPGLGIQYTNAIVYGTAAVLFITGMVCHAVSSGMRRRASIGVLLLVVGPFSDYGHYRKKLLVGCVAVWIPIFSLTFLVIDPELYGIGLGLTIVGAVAFSFGLRSPLAAYLPLLINANHELIAWTERHPSADLSPVQSGVAVEMSKDPIERTNGVHGEELEVQSPTGTAASGRHLLEDAPLSLSDTGCHDSDEYQRLYETIAGRTAIGESAAFISGQFFCLVLQIALFLLLSDADDPKDTTGERAAILVATIWGSVLSFVGISRLKNRPGGPFPPGNKFLIGGKRSLQTFKLLYDRMPRLLSLMIGRMLFWLSIQTQFAMSTLFFEREFAMGARELAPAVLIYFAVGIPSAIITVHLLQHFSGHLLTIFKVFCLLVMCLPLYIFLGIRERFEVYILMVLSAILITPFAAMVRAMMADMIPHGYSATIMSFEGVLENCSTWLGPLMVGGLLDATDSIRSGLLALELFMLLGLPFVFFTNRDKGHQERIAVEQLTKAR